MWCSCPRLIVNLSKDFHCASRLGIEYMLLLSIGDPYAGRCREKRPRSVWDGQRLLLDVNVTFGPSGHILNLKKGKTMNQPLPNIDNTGSCRRCSKRLIRAPYLQCSQTACASRSMGRAPACQHALRKRAIAQFAARTALSLGGLSSIAIRCNKGADHRPTYYSQCKVRSASADMV